EGKMRALFTLLFGASMMLFLERMEAAGRNGELLQLRRLGWLMLFGALHFFLFWWGDILFIYAVVGIVALMMRELAPKTLLIVALTIFMGWHLSGTALSLCDVAAEEHVRLGTATSGELQEHGEFLRQLTDRAAHELAEYRSGFVAQIAAKTSERPFWLLQSTYLSIGETLPLMLLGMVLYGSGFFSGGWPVQRLRTTAAIATVAGLVPTLAMLAWLWQRHFPPQAMTAALLYWLAIPHLLMALGYAALLVLAAPRLARTGPGRRLTAAGRMAFSNYLGTSIVMTAIFYGWGLGLVGTLGHAAQLPFLLLGWTLMLGWSAPWLRIFRRGPLEWLWRSLTEGVLLPIRR
ncbi:MAG: DUF418 domain-containing protein, partial [Novosphingobium sp.]|nr:DUF418 domain-containing protein [Novosphingobium sp.]